MQREEVLGILSDSDALLKGHFILSSGLHSAEYLQCALVQRYPDRLAVLSKALAEKWADAGVTAVVGPAVGGIVPGYELARQLGARAVFMERTPTGGFEFRRGFGVTADDRVLVADDVVTLGGSVRAVLKALETTDAEVVGVTSLVCRNTKVDFGVTYHYLVDFEIPAYKPESCPLCKAGVPAVKPGSRPDAKGAS